LPSLTSEFRAVALFVLSVDSSRVPRFGCAIGWLLVAIKPKVYMKNFARSSCSAPYKTGPRCRGKICIIECLLRSAAQKFQGLAFS